MNSKLKVTLITKLECLPCQGAKFILQKLQPKVNIKKF